MPIYEYQCAACGHEFEEWQKISDSPVKKCPKCSKHKVERLLSVSSFQLKGGGWYRDGYGSTKPGSGSGKGSGSGSGSSSTSKATKSKEKASSQSSSSTAAA